MRLLFSIILEFKEKAEKLTKILNNPNFVLGSVIILLILVAGLR